MPIPADSVFYDPSDTGYGWIGLFVLLFAGFSLVGVLLGLLGHALLRPSPSSGRLAIFGATANMIIFALAAFLLIRFLLPEIA